MPIRAALYDFDGVIIDSLEENHRALAEVFREHGVEPPDFPTYCQEITTPFYEFCVRCGLCIEGERIREAFIRMINREPIPLVPGFIDAVHGLVQREKILGVVSAACPGDVHNRLLREGLRDHFAAVVEDTAHKVDAILAFMERHNLKGEEVLFVGDLPSDIRDGKAAGVQTVAFGAFSPILPRLVAARPDHVIIQHPEILALVDRLSA